MTFYLCEGSIDLRKGITALVETIRRQLGKEPDLDDVFIFPCRDRRNYKLLHHCPGGYLLYQKRQKSDTPLLPVFNDGADQCEVTHEEMLSILAGAVCKKLLIV
ncbi:IS66 family insertion sequence element accessory protein TnpB [Phocaeicola sp.]